MRKMHLLVVLAVLAMAGGGAWYWRHTHGQLDVARAAMSRGDFRAAELVLRSLVRNNPSNVEGHFRLGTVQLALGDPVAAERELLLAKSGGWNDQQIAPLLARAYLDQGRFSDVLREFPVKEMQSDKAGPLLATRALAQLGLKQVDQAATTIDEAERVAPENIDVSLAAARIAIARNDVAAEAKVDHALAVNPHSIDALMLKGALRQTAGDSVGAMKAFDSAIEINPNVPALRIERANALLAAGQDKKALDDVAVVLKADARNPSANYLQMLLLARAKDWPGATAASQKIIPVIDRFPRGRYFEALIKMNLGETEQALDDAAHYIAREPGDVAGYKLLARIQSQNSEQAIETLNRAVTAGVADTEIFEMLAGIYIRTGQSTLARQMLDRATALAGDDAQALTRIAGVRLQVGDTSGAERELKKSLSLAPDQAGAGEQMVVAALAAGDVKSANAALEQLQRQPNSNSIIINNLAGRVRFAQLDFDGARSAFEATLRSDPANAEALAGMSRILIAQDQTDQMFQMLDTARKAAPAPTSAHITVAMAKSLADKGEYARADALIDQIPKEQASLADVMALRARLQVALGKQRDAQDTYRLILDASPGDVSATEQLALLLLQANDPAGARQVIRKGLDATPGNLRLLLAYVTATLRTDGLDAALRTAAKLANERAQLPSARLLKGSLFMSMKRYADAVAAFQAELKANPSGQLVIATASALNAAGRYADARQGLKDWIEHNPDDLKGMRALSELDLSNHQFDDAARDLNAELAKYPGGATDLNNLAWIYQLRNDPRARQLVEKAFLLTSNPHVGDTLGWILVNQGEAATGLPLLREAAQQLRSNPTVLYHLAVALDATGKKDEAAALLTALVKAGGNFDDKQAASKLLDDISGPKR